MRRARSAVLLVCLGSACGGDRPSGDRVDSGVRDAAAAGSDGAVDGLDAAAAVYASPEQVWLAGVGTGRAQTARVCARKLNDPVSRALCADPAPVIDGLASLRSALGLGDAARDASGNDVRWSFAVTAQSSGLQARTVSTLNPRVFVVGEQGDQVDTPAVLAFSRGEPFVELLGFDVDARRPNFYLLAFEPSCAAEGCRARDLISPSVEQGWRSFTLYEAEDLRDTGVDCLSCHQPGGAQAPRRMLMREVATPWLHWFPEAPFQTFCSGGENKARPRQLEDRFDAFQARASYGTLSADARHTASGHQLAAMMSLLASGRPSQQIGSFDPLLVEPEETRVDTSALLTESLCDGRHDAWARYRDGLRMRGLPSPFHADDPARADAPATLPELLARLPDERGARGAAAAADALEALLTDDAREAAGLVPPANADGATVLRQMCVRCHDRGVDPSLRRARFVIESLQDVTPSAAAAALDRIARAPEDPAIMPPRRTGRLTGDALERVRSTLRERCGGDCGRSP